MTLIKSSDRMKTLRMNEFKIGDKVKYKGTNQFLGYVSHIHKGHLFLLDNFEIRVHIGDGNHVINNANELELYIEKPSIKEG